LKLKVPASIEASQASFHQYITWEDNDMDSSSDSENEIANLSLMAKDYETEEEVTSSNYDLSISFDELQDAFNDLHKESIKLAKLVSFLR